MAYECMHNAYGHSHLKLFTHDSFHACTYVYLDFRKNYLFGQYFLCSFESLYFFFISAFETNFWSAFARTTATFNSKICTFCCIRSLDGDKIGNLIYKTRRIENQIVQLFTTFLPLTNNFEFEFMQDGLQSKSVNENGIILLLFYRNFSERANFKIFFRIKLVHWNMQF